MDKSWATNRIYDKQVLLLPFFTFQVQKIKVKDDLTQICLVELPFQNLLKIHPVSEIAVIWCDDSLSNSEQFTVKDKIEKTYPHVSMFFCTEMEECHKHLSQSM